MSTKLNLSLTKKIETLTLFDIVNNFDIGVNVEGLTRVIPSSFSENVSEDVRKKKYLFLMKVKPNYKLPSFQLGITEVVTAVAHAAVASNLVPAITQLKTTLILKVVSIIMTPGWINIYKTSFNTAFYNLFLSAEWSIKSNA